MCNLTQLKSILQNMTPGDWQVWTSNSFRRITADDQPDGGVLSGTRQHDGYPDLAGLNRNADLKGICALKNEAHLLIEIAEAAKSWWHSSCTCGYNLHLSTCSRQIALDRLSSAISKVGL